MNEVVTRLYECKRRFLVGHKGCRWARQERVSDSKNGILLLIWLVIYKSTQHTLWFIVDLFIMNILDGI